MKKYIVLFAKNILLQIFTFAFLLGMVYAAGTLITNFQQNVSDENIITSSWYNSVNTMLKGPHTDGGICAYVDGKIMCNNTSTSDTTLPPSSSGTTPQDCGDGQVLQGFDVTGNKICKELTSSSASSGTIVAGCLGSGKYDSGNSVGHPSNCWGGASAMHVENLGNGCPSGTTIRYILITSGPFFVCTKN